MGTGGKKCAAEMCHKRGIDSGFCRSLLPSMYVLSVYFASRPNHTMSTTRREHDEYKG